MKYHSNKKIYFKKRRHSLMTTLLGLDGPELDSQNTCVL